MNTETKINDLFDQAQAHKELKHDYVAKPTDLYIGPDGSIILPSTIFADPTLAPTEWAWRQMFSKLGPTVFGKGSTKSLPFDYLTALPVEEMANLVNGHLAAHENGDWLVRGYGDTARAVLSRDYVSIDNAAVIDTTKRVLDEKGGGSFKLINSWVTPDRLCMRVVIKDEKTPVGTYGVGFYVENGEIGNKRFRLLPFVMRTSCTNSTIWDHDSGMEFIHRGGNATVRSMLVSATIVEVLGGSMALLDKMVTAESEKIPNFTDVVGGLAMTYGWNKDVENAVHAGSEGKHTRAGLIHGVTYAAHAAVTDQESQVSMEMLGGKILDMPQGLFTVAAHRHMAEV